MVFPLRKCESYFVINGVENDNLDGVNSGTNGGDISIEERGLLPISRLVSLRQIVTQVENTEHNHYHNRNNEQRYNVAKSSSTVPLGCREIDFVHVIILRRATSCSIVGRTHNFIFLEVSLAPRNTKSVLLALPILIEEGRPENSHQHIHCIGDNHCHSDLILRVPHVLENEDHEANKASPEQELRVKRDELKITKFTHSLQGNFLPEVRSDFVGWVVEWIAAAILPFLF